MFLDDIDEAGLEVQGRILSVLEHGWFERPHTRTRVKADVRVIGATGKSLVSRMKDGAFRVDLFYRLKIVSVFIPPLRERIDDIPYLAQHFLERARASMQRDIEGMSPGALRLLQEHSWPGNIRELEQAVQRAVALCRTGVLGPEDFRTLTEDAEHWPAPEAAGAGSLAAFVRAEYRKLRAASETRHRRPGGVGGRAGARRRGHAGGRREPGAGGASARHQQEHAPQASRGRRRRAEEGDGIVTGLRSRTARVACLLAALLVAAGCSHYSFSPSLRTGPRTVAVPVLGNDTLEYGAEQGATDAIITTLTEDNSMRVVPEGEAEAVIRGRVTTYERPVFSYDAAGNPREYRVRVAADLSYEDRRTGTVIWEGQGRGMGGLRGVRRGRHADDRRGGAGGRVREAGAGPAFQDGPGLVARAAASFP